MLIELLFLLNEAVGCKIYCLYTSFVVKVVTNVILFVATIDTM